MASTHSPVHTLQESTDGRGGYIDMLNMFRIIACATVLTNHAFIWTGMSTNVIGTGFIALLHLSRNSFFFLSGLVVCYTQITRPKAARSFWKRRYVQLGVPYLAWTAIYLLFKTIRVSFSWHEVEAFLRMNLITGYSQLYAAFVIFQYYLVFPLLLRLLRATRRHGLIMAVSLTFALALGLVLHYPTWVPPLTDACRALSHHLPWSRDLLTYQEFFVAGALVAYHFDAMRKFVSQHRARLMTASGAVGGLMIIWYVVQVHTGSTLLQASDPYQSAGVIWYCAAIVAIFTISQWWDQRSDRRTGNRSIRRADATAKVAALTGGVWLCHNLILSSLRALLQATGLRASLPWEATVAILFSGTVVLSMLFVSGILRTRLRWVIGGPVRSEQRSRMNAEQATLQAALATSP